MRSITTLTAAPPLPMATINLAGGSAGNWESTWISNQRMIVVYDGDCSNELWVINPSSKLENSLSSIPLDQCLLSSYSIIFASTLKVLHEIIVCCQVTPLDQCLLSSYSLRSVSVVKLLDQFMLSSYSLRSVSTVKLLL